MFEIWTKDFENINGQKQEDDYEKQYSFMISLDYFSSIYCVFNPIGGE